VSNLREQLSTGFKRAAASLASTCGHSSKFLNLDKRFDLAASAKWRASACEVEVKTFVEMFGTHYNKAQGWEDFLKVHTYG